MPHSLKELKSKITSYTKFLHAIERAREIIFTTNVTVSFIGKGLTWMKRIYQEHFYPSKANNRKA